MDKRQRRVLQNKGKNKIKYQSEVSENLSRMIKTKRVLLHTFEDYITHYALSIPFLILPVGALWFLLQDFTFDSFIFFTISLAVFASIFFMQYYRLRFKKVESKISVTDLHKIIKEIATELDWHTHVFAEGTYAQTHPPFWSGSWGEDIIVLSDKKNELVLVNSICSLQKRSSVFAFGRNRKNEQRLIKKIKEYEANQLR